MNNSPRIFLVAFSRYAKLDSLTRKSVREIRKTRGCGWTVTPITQTYHRPGIWCDRSEWRSEVRVWRRYRRYYRASQLLRLPLCWLHPTILNRYVNRHPHCKRKQQQDWKIRHCNNISARWAKSREGRRQFNLHVRRSCIIRHIFFGETFPSFGFVNWYYYSTCKCLNNFRFLSIYIIYIKIIKSWSILRSKFNTISGLLGFHAHLFLKLTISLSVYANTDANHIPVEMSD